MSIFSDTANAFLIFGLCSGVICAYDAATDSRTEHPDMLAAHSGDMQPNTYYAGDVVARYAAMPASDSVTRDFPDAQDPSFLKSIWRHMGAHLAASHSSGRIAP